MNFKRAHSPRLAQWAVLQYQKIRVLHHEGQDVIQPSGVDQHLLLGDYQAMTNPRIQESRSHLSMILMRDRSRGLMRNLVASRATQIPWRRLWKTMDHGCRKAIAKKAMLERGYAQKSIPQRRANKHQALFCPQQGRQARMMMKHVPSACHPRSVKILC